MGRKSYMESEGFSAELNAYLAKVLADNGREDLSGKWLEEITGKARRYDYWGRLVKGERAATTNDIQVLANAFGISPYEWVSNARRHNLGQPVPVVTFNVLPHEEDYHITKDPGEHEAGAAETPRDPAG